MQQLLMAAFAAVILAFSTAAVDAKEAPASAADRIRADMAWLADDARKGRETGSREYDEAAAFVVRKMKSAGLAAAEKRAWRQIVPLRAGKRLQDAAVFELKSGDETRMLAHLEDYLIGINLADEDFAVEAPLAFAGYGVTAPEEGIDDYAGIDASGKIVVMFGGAPRTLNNEQRAYYASGEVKLQNAAAHGASGVIHIMSKEASARTPWERLTSGAGRSAMTTLAPDGSAEVAAPAIIGQATMSDSGAQKLFAGTPFEFAALRESEAANALKAFDLGKEARIAGKAQLQALASANIIGVIEGSDPVLRKEVVLLTAHLDHIGVSPSAKPGEDAINNGALDNASGVAVMLEAARMFARSGAAPKRTVAFAALTGEEKGLLGSKYLARHPAFGDRRIVSNVNLDMPIALYPFTDVIAFGAERSSLGPAVRSAANSMGIALADDPLPQENLFIRSDHYSFVRQGVPAVFLVTGWANGGEKAFAEFLKTHYHKPSDDLALPIDYDSLVRFADLNYRISRALADAPQSPSWNDGDFVAAKFSR